MKHSFIGDLCETKKIFLFNSMLITFFHLIGKGFFLVHVFVFSNKLDRIRRQNFGAKVA